MEGKNLAKKIAMALLCTAALPAASQATHDAEFQTFLAKGGCGGEEDSSSSNKNGCGAASNQKKSHSCGAATKSHSCGAATTNSHACGAATKSHSCGASTPNKHSCGAQTDSNNYQSGSAVYNNDGTRNRNQQFQTSYTGASTLPGPNDGYPSTPRERSYSDYPKNDNINSKNYEMNQR
ncbi:MAG: hypothetical protein Q8K60_09615 [Parachlamydiaceae bacterium]|nr:hypothetical protein [Parachlamydiaceae bacterium]